MQRPGWEPADPPSLSAPPDPPPDPPVDQPGPPAGSPWASAPADRSGSPWAAPPEPVAAGAHPATDPTGQHPAAPHPGPHQAGPGAYPSRPEGPPVPGGYSAAPGPYPGGTDAPAGAGPYWPGPGPYAPGPGEVPYGEGGWPGRPSTRPSWPPTRRELTAAVATVAGLALLGAALAVLWVWLAPRLEFRVVQPGRAVPVIPEAEEYVAADGRFVLLTLAAGVVAGLVCWLLRRTRGPVVLAALALGGLLGAVVTWRLGVALAPGYSPADLQEVGRTVMEPLALKAQAALVVEPVAAVVVYLLAAGFTVHNDLGVEQDPSAGTRVS